MPRSQPSPGGPLPPDWQETPTKLEWKSLAKLYVQRRRKGETKKELKVLGEALRSCGIKAAWQMMMDVNAELAPQEEEEPEPYFKGSVPPEEADDFTRALDALSAGRLPDEYAEELGLDPKLFDEPGM